MGLCDKQSENTIAAGDVADLPTGRMTTIDTPDGERLVIYNVNGELFATENFCPHRGAPLSEGFLCGHIIECGLHGWQFDVRTGKCLTVDDQIKSFPVKVEDGSMQVEIRRDE